MAMPGDRLAEVLEAQRIPELIVLAMQRKGLSRITQRLEVMAHLLEVDGDDVVAMLSAIKLTKRKQR